MKGKEIFIDRDFKSLKLEFLLKYKRDFNSFILGLDKLAKKHGIKDNTKYNKAFAKEFKEIYKMDILKFTISFKKLLKKHNYKLLKDGRLCKTM